MNKLYIFFATGFYSGYAPKAPGTAGSLLAALLLMGMYQIFPEAVNTHTLLGIIFVFFVIGIITANQLESTLGKDPACIVIDEFVGMWITLLFLPLHWWTIVVGFALFRFFDILKPLFIGTIDQKVKGSWGVMLDDVLAGIYANICLQFIVWFVN
ncbi:MAG: phosphatidylglycerophosphatase A [Chitinophagales bacterium]